MKTLELNKMEKIEGGGKSNKGVFIACAGMGLMAGLSIPVIGGFVALITTASCYYLERQ